jgi:hypothetical protein
VASHSVSVAETEPGLAVGDQPCPPCCSSQLITLEPEQMPVRVVWGAHVAPFRVLLDGEAPGPSHGVDVDEDGNGLLRDGRLYQLVREQDAVRERTLEITFLEPGAEAYAFTFG